MIIGIRDTWNYIKDGKFFAFDKNTLLYSRINHKRFTYAKT